MNSRRRSARSCVPDRDLSLHFIGGEGLLLDRSGHRLYALNASATLIWCLLDEGKPPAEIRRLLIERYAVPAGQAESVGHAKAVPELTPAEVTALPAAPDLQARPRPAAIATYGLLGSVVRVHYATDRLHDTIHPLLQHHALHGVPPTSILDVVAHDDGIAILSQDRVIGSSRAHEDAGVAVRACLTQIATAQSGGLCVVHAGALSRKGGALLLPGNAGYGKSTLSAGLAARGFDMLSDDTTLLAGEPPIAHCIQNGLCIKRGAYDVLKPLYPGLDALPEWRRPDGKHARYLMPGSDLSWAAPESAVGVRWMVFPRYHPDHETTLLPLPRHEALARLLPGVCFLSGTLDDRNLEALIAWIERIDCFDLPLSSLDDATALIDRLCR